jgi:hypothetical protein
VVDHRHHLLSLLIHHLRIHVHLGNTHLLPRCLRPLLKHWVSHLRHGLRNAWSYLRLLSLNVRHLIHHGLLWSYVCSCHLLCLKHVYIGDLCHSCVHSRVSPCHHWGHRLSKLRGPHSSCCPSHHSRMDMLLRVVLGLPRHSHHCCRTWSHWHARHSSRLKLRNWLACDCGNMLIILIYEGLYLHERCLSKSHRCIRVDLCYLIQIVLPHIFVAVLDEYISGDFSLYILQLISVLIKMATYIRSQWHE